MTGVSIPYVSKTKLAIQTRAVLPSLTMQADTAAPCAHPCRCRPALCLLPAGSTDAFQGRMLCDCTTTKDESRTYEYPRANLSLYFKWWTGWPYEVHGRWGHPPFRNATPCRTPACYGSGCSTEPGECRHEHDWSLPLPTALRQVGAATAFACPPAQACGSLAGWQHILRAMWPPPHWPPRSPPAWLHAQVVSQLSPSAIILNSGMWRGTSKESSPPSFARAVAKAALKAVAPQRGTVVWRTTTPSLRLNVTHAWDAPFLAAPRLHVLDAWQMLRPLLAYQPVPYYDHYHPWPEVYTELNTALLNMLC